jgi:hypothetical protein
MLIASNRYDLIDLNERNNTLETYGYFQKPGIIEDPDLIKDKD